MDSRCADPDLQLDVDAMILEYTLFQAVDALLQGLLNPQDDPSDGSRLTAIFDGFVRIFNEHHPRYEHSPSSSFRLDVLEFLVLLSALYSGTLSGFADEMLRKLELRTQEDIRARQKWQMARQRQYQRRDAYRAPRSQAYLEREAEQQIYLAWEKRETSSSGADSHPMHTILLFSLVPRFMVISAKFVDMIGQSLEHRWMQVACELMLRAGLESMYWQTRNGHTDLLPSLEDCFAWGYVEPDGVPDFGVTAAYDEEIMGLVNQMFCSSINSSSSAGSEDPGWTSLRLETLREFLMDADATSVSQRWRLERLADKYPMDSFVQNLAGVVQNIWSLSCRDEYLGKPVLVEIEEGHLQSLDIVGAEFDEFASKVGLTSNDVSLSNKTVGAQYLSTVGLLEDQSLTVRLEHNKARGRKLSVSADVSSVMKLEDCA